MNLISNKGDQESEASREKNVEESNNNKELAVPTSPNQPPNDGRKGKILIGACAAVGAVGMVAATPLILAGVGFTSGGIAAGSYATSIMSSAAIANGGGVAAGGIVATAQGVGAAGLGTIGTAVVGTVGGALGGGIGLVSNKLYGNQTDESNGNAVGSSGTGKGEVLGGIAPATSMINASEIDISGGEAANKMVTTLQDMGASGLQVTGMAMNTVGHALGSSTGFVYKKLFGNQTVELDGGTDKGDEGIVPMSVETVDSGGEAGSGVVTTLQDWGTSGLVATRMAMDTVGHTFGSGTGFVYRMFGNQTVELDGNMDQNSGTDKGDGGISAMSSAASMMPAETADSGGEGGSGVVTTLQDWGTSSLVTTRMAMNTVGRTLGSGTGFVHKKLFGNQTVELDGNMNQNSGTDKGDGE